ncbi:MAG TPA: ankyrin repeat domain-containing protein, partial [Pyrinomonadaceae bacterium]|nr:ankyrin repeat domain-containing protein [Pyrinomonadaceae bacterium]
MSSAVPLTQAVTSGDANAVRAALAGGADVNERNNGGQTALILAVIFSHTDVVRLLVQAGADPRLRDNLGLDAVEWAHRRGLTDIVDLFTGQVPVQQPPIENDEKSRKWLEGVKKRIAEQSAKQEQAAPQPPPPPPPVVSAKPEPAPAPEPEPEPEPKPEAVAAPKTTATQKRCPKCNAIYNSELVAYCAHHLVRLVDLDEPVFEPPQSVASTIANTPLLWTLILATVAIAAF